MLAPIRSATCSAYFARVYPCGCVTVCLFVCGLFIGLCFPACLLVSACVCGPTPASVYVGRGQVFASYRCITCRGAGFQGYRLWARIRLVFGLVRSTPCRTQLTLTDPLTDLLTDLLTD